jgi:hypothetical protein
MLKNIIIMLLLLASCSGMQQNKAKTETLALDVGYVCYRAIPEVRPVLSGVCVVKDLATIDERAAALRAILQKVWVDANKITSTDAQFAVLALNNLVGISDFHNGVAGTADVINPIIDGLCKGVSLAGK